jgi:hypothetical protein
VKCAGGWVLPSGLAVDQPMVMPTCGTCDYAFVVHEASVPGRAICGALREPIEKEQERLLGHAPLLQTVEYEKWQLCRITLTATEKNTGSSQFEPPGELSMRDPYGEQS